MVDGLRKRRMTAVRTARRRIKKTIKRRRKAVSEAVRRLRRTRR